MQKLMRVVDRHQQRRQLLPPLPRALGRRADRLLRALRAAPTRSTTSTAPASSCSAGANPTEAHPVVGARIKQRVICTAPGWSSSTRAAPSSPATPTSTCGRAPAPTSPSSTASPHVLIAEGLIDEEFIGARTEGFEAAPRAARRLPAGAGRGDLRRAGRRPASRGRALYGEGEARAIVCGPRGHRARARHRRGSDAVQPRDR